MVQAVVYVGNHKKEFFRNHDSSVMMGCKESWTWFSSDVLRSGGVGHEKEECMDGGTRDGP